MGSFSYTCALSELTIASGDPVLLVALAGTNSGLNSGACSRFELAFPPMKAVYDDYGFVEDIETTPFHDACARQRGYDSALKYAKDLGEGKVVAADAYHSEVKITFCLARQDAWEAMLDMPCEWRGLGSADATAARPLAAAAARQGSSFLAAATDDPAQAHADPQRVIFSLGMKLCKEVDPQSAFGSIFSRSLFKTHGYEMFYGGSLLSAFAIELPNENAELRDFEDALLLCAQATLINMAMHSLRKVWIDRDSSGPQFGEPALQWLWARKLLDLSDAAISWEDDEQSDYMQAFGHAKALRERDVLEAHAPTSTASLPGLGKSL